MKITEALEVIRNAPKSGKPYEVALACGFMPLHLQTFLTAHLQRALPNAPVLVAAGLFGNLIETVEQSARTRVPHLVIALEWADLDPRLGYRSRHLVTKETASDAVAASKAAFARLAKIIQDASRDSRIILSTPTLPISPIFHTNSWQLSVCESILQRALSDFEEAASQAGACVLNKSKLAIDSPPGTRYDYKSDLYFGLPYSVSHADTLASAFARLIQNQTRFKGIITDLDDTLWAGLVGEVGPGGISWDLEHHAGAHASYQMLLSSLSDAGVLIGVASKNDMQVVEKAFQRKDILLQPDKVFPMEVHWKAKSGSVTRILQAWNIDADYVVFIDDNPAELGEVSSQHPGIRCIQFPNKDYEACFKMLHELRDLFGKSQITAEDSIRLESLRNTAAFRSIQATESSEEFLRSVDAVVSFEDQASKCGSRPLELVNKTNQFNLNGVRVTESEWQTNTSSAGSCFLLADYRDRFGMLGKIAVVLGHLHEDSLRVQNWVMSCRAFGRRIEHLCLRTLFDQYDLRQIEFEFAPTEKNGPFRSFMESIVGELAGRPLVLTRERFNDVCPPLYHTTSSKGSSISHGRNKGPLSEVL
jgi:FkbH-like protein